MSNREEAKYFDSHKEDDGDWLEPVRRAPSASRKLAAMISVRFSPEEAEAVRVAANEQGVSISQFVRASALAKASPAVSAFLPWSVASFSGLVPTGGMESFRQTITGALGHIDEPKIYALP